MSNCIFAILVPIWIGIVFNLAMTAANIMLSSSSSRIAQWYWNDRNAYGLMIAVWAALILWSIANAVTYCPSQ